MRMAAIRKVYAAVTEPTDVKCNPKSSVKLKTYHIDCMYKCGDKVKVIFNIDDIVPHLGKPRGFHKACPKCTKRNNYDTRKKY